LRLSKFNSTKIKPIFRFKNELLLGDLAGEELRPSASFSCDNDADDHN